MAERFLSKGLVTSRQVNPLDPDYNLSPVPPRYPPLQLRFLQNGFEVNDIAGAQPKSFLRYEQRDNMNAYSQAIPNCKPKPAYIRSTPFDSLNYSDVTANRRFASQRRIDPLDPKYDVRYYGGENFFYGDIDGSKPSPFSRYSILTNHNLNTADIKGAQAGTKNRHADFRYDNALSLSGGDIVGSKAGSRKKGMITKRQTNPLQPQYEYLGQAESKNYFQGKFNEYGDRLIVDDRQKKQMVRPPVKAYQRENNLCFTIPAEVGHSKPYPDPYPYTYSRNDYPHYQGGGEYSKEEGTDYREAPMNYHRRHDQYLVPSSSKPKKQITLNENIVDLGRHRLNRELLY